MHMLASAPHHRNEDAIVNDRSEESRRLFWRMGLAKIRRFIHHPDPLVEMSNWVAIIIGTHLPFWPLYIWWSSDSQALPSALLTAALTPVFILIPFLSHWNGLLGRIAMLLMGTTNTVLTIWILGANTGTDLFLVPCTALAIILFRHNERWLMLIFTTLPVVVWYVLKHHPINHLHLYTEAQAHEILILTAISIGFLMGLFGWLQANTYRRIENAHNALTQNT